ncbi:MAG: hypothetical protein KC619_13120 [Myxococcales bacterium]|nr:hypothetical protein [Myxococcales bacterium]
MTSRHSLTLASLLAVALGGCSQSHTMDDDGGTPPADGGGVCCPIVTSFAPCSPGSEPLPGGGWASSLAHCDYTISGFDVDFDRTVDAHGCPILRESSRCCLCPPDAGPPEPDCAGLGEVACLAVPGCVATYHDACCSMCEPGLGCADCTDWEFWSCETFTDACGHTTCGDTPLWVCPEAPPNCGAATPTGLGACSVPGCVPVVAAEGFMDPAQPCAPVTAGSCTTSCRMVMPTCPEGTTAEGDGFCYTGLCIPAEVCGG